MEQNSRQQIFLKLPCLALGGLKLRVPNPRILDISRERMEVKKVQVGAERNLPLRAIIGVSMHLDSAI